MSWILVTFGQAFDLESKAMQSYMELREGSRTLRIPVQPEAIPILTDALDADSNAESPPTPEPPRPTRRAPEPEPEEDVEDGGGFLGLGFVPK